jgi:hypothetical protein
MYWNFSLQGLEFSYIISVALYPFNRSLNICKDSKHLFSAIKHVYLAGVAKHKLVDRRHEYWIPFNQGPVPCTLHIELQLHFRNSFHYNILHQARNTSLLFQYCCVTQRTVTRNNTNGA